VAHLPPPSGPVPAFPKTKKLTYRPDIDGLRALAVLAVVVYHAFPGLMPGGFVGVDVFFVISGFLISGIILDDLAQGNFTFRAFYARRIRRIFPALFMVLAAVLIFGWFALLPDEYTALGKHVFGGAAFISNILFWREAGYWDVSAQVKPLLHLWSLGIEEQFYIIFPCLVALAWKKKLRLLTVILVLLIVSFSLNIHYYKRNPVLDFYAPYTRFWELLAGVVLSVLARSKYNLTGARAKIEALLAWPMAFLGVLLFEESENRAKPALPDLLSWLGFLVLLVTIFTNSSHDFPGRKAVWPVLGAVCLIAAGPATWINQRVLSHKLAVAIGLISYPLYLWHWPLLSYVHILQGAENEIWTWRFIRLACVLAAVILAFLTYKLVERPIRFGQRAKTLKTCALIFMIAAVGGAGLYVKFKEGLPERSMAKNLSVFSNMLEYDLFRDEAGLQYALEHVPTVSESAYTFKPNGEHFAIDDYDNKDSISFMKATIVPGSKSKIALLGDSHAWSAYPGIAKRNAKFGISTLVMADGASRAPILGLDSQHDDDIEKELIYKFNEWIDYLCHDVNMKQVYIFHYWGYATAHPDEFRRAIQSAADKLNAFGKNVLVVADIPTLPFDIRSKAPTRPFQFKKNASATFMRSAEENEQQKKYLEILDSLKNLTIIKNTTEVFCPDGNCVFLSEDGLPLYVNNSHITPLGSDYLVEHLLEPYLARIAEEAKR
jgi:peptidoglycan/LPS O-acetylase OafA/YrhL